MKAKGLRILFVLMILSVSMSGWVYASNRVNLLKNGTTELEIIPSRGISISRVSVIQDDDQIVIKGKIKRRSSSRASSGHIDISIVTPEGEVFAKVSTLYIPRIIPSKLGRRSRFEVSLPMIPPKGSKIRIAHHRPSKSVSKDFSCNKNRAALDVGT